MGALTNFYDTYDLLTMMKAFSFFVLLLAVDAKNSSGTTSYASKSQPAMRRLSKASSAGRFDLNKHMYDPRFCRFLLERLECDPCLMKNPTRQARKAFDRVNAKLIILLGDEYDAFYKRGPKIYRELEDFLLLAGKLGLQMTK